MLEGLLNGLQQSLAWPGPVIILVGVGIGLLVGVLPGIGPAGGTALILPATYAMEPSQAIAFILAVNVSSGLGGQLTSILMNVPGDAPNAATVLDGYPMARQGRAAEAIGAATLGSIAGAVLGTGMLMAVIPVARELVLSFSYPEFFMIALLGLVSIAALTRGNTLKGLSSAGLGLMIAFIGLDPATANPRFVFGQLYLWDGIDLVAALIGLFAGAEMLSLFVTRGEATIIDDASTESKSRLSDGFAATIREWRNVVASSIIGFMVGVVPGLGGSVASFMAYGRAAQMSKHPEAFGQGEVGGVIASETANDADKSGSIITTLAFGIPGGTSMAILLAALTLHGFQTGPALIAADSQILYVILIALLLPRMIAAVVVLALSRQAIAVTRVPGNVLAPIVVVTALVSVYALRQSIADIFITVIFGYIGYAMERFGFSRVALVIGMVLGPLVEAAFTQTMGTFGLTGFYARPISGGILIVIILMLLIEPLRRRVGRRDSVSKEASHL